MNLSPKSVSIIVVVSSDKSWWPSAQDFLQYGWDHLVCDIAAKYLKQVKASKFCYIKTLKEQIEEPRFEVGQCQWKGNSSERHQHHVSLTF